jgi:hypothetical protein
MEVLPTVPSPTTTAFRCSIVNSHRRGERSEGWRCADAGLRYRRTWNSRRVRHAKRSELSEFEGSAICFRLLRAAAYASIWLGASEHR